MIVQKNIMAGLSLLFATFCTADTYRFNDAVGSDWMNGQNWQNQTAGINGWQAGGIPLPGADDTVRFNYGNSAGTLAADAGTVDALQLGVDEGGSLALNAGAILATDSGNWSGIGAGGASAGTLTINGGSLTIANTWKMGNNDNAHTATLEINGGSMHVTAGGFVQTKPTTISQTTLNGGLLHVNSLSLSSGTINIAGGTLKIDGDKTGDVASWVGAGYLVAYGGVAGAGIDAAYSNSATWVTASTVAQVTVPDVTGQTQSSAEADLVSAGLVVGDVSLASGLPGNPTPGTVYSQTPIGGVEVAFGSTVDLLVVADPLPPPDTEDLTPSADITEGSFTTESYDGRTVWVPNNAGNRLYFKVPASFDFDEGVPVYVRIEYEDTGRGWFFVEYDSNVGNATADKFKDSEIHARSSRVGQGGFVYNYQMFEFPLFDRRQNGGNDFRLALTASDGTPLRIASVQISNRPYEDGRFEYAISRPWLQPYTGETHHLTDTNTLVGKVMAGYQGWFATPNDADDVGWRHWGRSAGDDPSPTEITVDMWPWINEYSTDALYAAGGMVLGDGRPAYLFSSRDPETVQRHFRWMRKHNIDGAYLQRFVSRNSSGYYGAPEFVLSNVRAAANKEGRVWAIEYDVSSLTGEANPLEVIQNDWNYLVNECHILEDPRYVHEGGKPVLFIWGFSVPGREGLTLAEADSILDWFGTQNLYLIGGVHSSWESNTGWYGHYQKYDQILAWMERTKSDLESQRDRLAGWGMKILPHAWPGFSWHNLQKLVPLDQYTARAAGQFYWDRIYNAVDIGADQIFLGMFDEYDEGTAIMPMSDNHPVAHTAWGHYIDNEGLDPFWYLRLSGAGRDMLNGLRPLTSAVPSEGSVPAGGLAGEVASVQLGTTDIPSGLVHNQNPDGITEGALVGGFECRTNLNPYLYFDIDDALCFGNAAGQTATIEVDFHDNYPGTTFRVQYDALSGSYANTAVISPSASGGWKTVRWTVDDGYFGNRQNAGSDFRIALGGTAEAAIRSVRVAFPEEQSEVVEQPTIEFADGTLAWPVLSDAVGWRLHETDNLASNVWTEVVSGLGTTNGRVVYEVSTTGSNTFFKLSRPARK